LGFSVVLTWIIREAVIPGNKNILRNSSCEEGSIPGIPDYYHDIRTEQNRIGGDPRGDWLGFSLANKKRENPRPIWLDAIQLEKGNQTTEIPAVKKRFLPGAPILVNKASKQGQLTR
jgi:hypothetical protein